MLGCPAARQGHPRLPGTVPRPQTDLLARTPAWQTWLLSAWSSHLTSALPESADNHPAPGHLPTEDHLNAGAAAGTMNQQQREQPDEEAPGDETCAICLGQLSNSAQLDPCGHCFCRQCIQPWATQRFTCPMCHGRIEAIERLEPRAQRDASTRQRLERNMGMA
uniref:RING-type domain-containing protein n=1 Tax=Anas zonorhyncha TaxID=75864 RepID=A0A8B9VGW2_9AVES